MVRPPPNSSARVAANGLPADPDQLIAWFIDSAHDELLAAVMGQASDAAVAGTTEVDFDYSLRTDLATMTREGLQSLLACLPSDEWNGTQVPPVSDAFARTIARRGFDRAVMLKMFRLGQTVFWRMTMTVAAKYVEDPELRSTVLAVIWERLTRWLEALLERQMTAYHDERSLWLHGSWARRNHRVNAILAGQDADIDAAGQDLGYQLRRLHTAAVVWSEDATRDDDATRLIGLTQTLARAVELAQPLILPAGSHEVRVWLGADAAIEARQLAQVFIGCRSAHDRLAIGTAGPGVDGFRRSHVEALAAQRVALADTCSPVCTDYHDVEIVSLMSRDEPAMRTFVARELGCLAGTDDVTARLRQTTLAYLRAGCSLRAAGFALGSHKNTVSKRIARVEDLLGRSVTANQPRLLLALLLAEVFGTG